MSCLLMASPWSKGTSRLACFWATASSSMDELEKLTCMCRLRAKYSFATPRRIHARPVPQDIREEGQSGALHNNSSWAVIALVPGAFQLLFKHRPLVGFPKDCSPLPADCCVITAGGLCSQALCQWPECQMHLKLAASSIHVWETYMQTDQSRVWASSHQDDALLSA